MALLFLSSCGDVYNTQPDTNLDWTQVFGTPGTFIIVPGRNGNGFQLGSVERTFAPQANATVGFAIKIAAFSGDLVQFNNTQNSSGLRVSNIGDGRVQVILNVFDNSASGPVSTFSFNINQWYYIELNAQVSFSGGQIHCTYDLHVNESSILSGTLSATPALLFSGDGTFSSITFQQNNNDIIDDVTLTDGEFLGDVDIGVLFPRLDGDTIQWLPSSGMTHFNLVNEHTPDFDATYVQTPTVGNIDQYFLDLIVGFSGTIKGARLLLCVKKTDSGLASVQGVYKSGGGTTVLTGNDFFASDTSYIYAWYTSRKSVFTGLDWTPAEVNAAQFGIKRTN